MPWKALPYVEREKKASLAKRYKCLGIPHLVFVDPKTWETITLEGTRALKSESFLEDFPYYPASSSDLSVCMKGLMGKDPVLLVFTDMCEAGTKKEVSGVVRTFADSSKEKGNTYLAAYFTANGSSGMEKQMRPAFGLSKHNPPPAKHDKPLTLMVPETDNIGAYTGGWSCNGCKRYGTATEANWRHKGDQFDYCDACYQKAYAAGDALPQFEKPTMMILNFNSKLFWAPKEGEEAVTHENIQKLLDNHQAGNLAESKLIM